MKRFFILLTFLATTLSLTGCVYNDFQRLDEDTKSAWSEVLKKVFDGNPRELCLHSMRHYARDQFALDPSIPEKIRYDLIGHEATDVDTRTYGEATRPRARAIRCWF